MEHSRARSAYYQKLVKLSDLVKKHATTPFSIDEANTLLERTLELMTACEDSHMKVIAVSADDAAITVQEKAFEPIETLFLGTKTKLKTIIRTLQPASTNPPTSTPQLNMKLPPIELPTFDGNFANWPSFKDLFVATVDNNTQLAPSQKLQYLKSAVQNEPSTLIKSLTITDAHYKEAWDILKDRYDNTREIIHSILNKLLYQKSLQAESPHDLQKLIDSSVECLRSLRVLKLPVDHWDAFLVVVHVNKLDPSTRREWAIRQQTNTLPTWKEFVTFTTNHIRGLLATGVSATSEKKTANGAKTIRSHHSSTEAVTCLMCKGNHQIYRCQEFLAKDPNERSNQVRRLKLCYNCLNRDHRISDCKSKSTCKKCSRRHHTLLHSESQTASVSSAPKQAQDNQQQTSSQPQPGTSLNSFHTDFETQVLLSTAIVHVSDGNGGLQLCRILLDSGSQGSLITEDCVKRLGLKREWSRVTVSGISSSSAGTTKGKVQLVLMNNTNNSIKMSVEAHVLSKITGLQPRLRCKVETWGHLQGLQLADPQYYQPGTIDILVGADCVALMMREGRKSGPINAPIAQDTIFGWVLSGRVDIQDPTMSSFHIDLSPDLASILQKFWELEELPRTPILTADEKICEEHFIKHVSRGPSGRFIVALPFNNRKHELGESRTAAVRQLIQVERRLKRKPDQQQQYIQFMKEYEHLGHMTRIPSAEAFQNIGNTYYLPHHYVLNNSSSTTRLRVVFNGSYKTSTGVSLNDTLFVGATLQEDLYNILLRFRSHPIVLKADMAKMFRQFQLREEDSDFHRIVWRESPTDPISDYKLRTVTYGTACATYLSTRCLQQLAFDCKDKYPYASAALNRDTYVDDLMTGTETANSAIQQYQQLTTAVGEAGLDLRKWSSNNPEVLSQIPEEQRETSLHSFDPDQVIKALGVQWNPSTDNFVFKYVKVSDSSLLTKRVLLSDLSRVFDPLGFLTAVTVKAKLMLQELWRLAIDWDEAVPNHISEAWQTYQDDLKNITRVCVPRHIFIPHESSRYSLHGFADSSERAFGCISYLRTEHPDGEVVVSFITSKSRIAPLKQVSLPRLELCAAVMLSKLIIHVKESLKLNCEIVCWTDSTITLNWIKSQPRRWKTFVANRVALIQENVPSSCWRHVPGVENPADLTSRGTSAESLIENDFWWKGPTWLSSDSIPLFNGPDSQSSSTDLEERANTVNTHHTVIDVSIMERFSSLERLKRVTARIRRLFHNAKTDSRADKRSGPLSVSELKDAATVWIKVVQQQAFSEEIKALRDGKQIKHNSKLKRLSPYVDSKGVLRVGGRLSNTPGEEGRKHQVILPSDSHFTFILIHHYHRSFLHSGFQMTLSSLQAEYWILRGRDKVRHIIRSCVVCRRHRAKTADQVMADLPSVRVTPSRAFLHTGVDYAGPFILKNTIGRSPKTYKGYLCLFVCMVTKAIHLEAVSSLSTEAFIATLRRFVARRGLCAQLYSDNGTNFVGAEKELKKFISSSYTNSCVSDALSAQGISWSFHPPASPHHNGISEAGVKSAKFHLRRVIGNSLLTFEQFTTILCQVEAVLNSRPLHPMSPDPSDLIALTPGHFLIGEPLLAVPDADLNDVNKNRLSVFQAQQQRVQHFWRRWSSDYLNTLQQRNKWFWEKTDLSEGDMVILKEETSPANWKLGRITSVQRGQDGKVRVVKVKTSTGELVRPIVKLIPLIRSQ